MVSHALPPSVVVSTSIGALARVGSKFTPFARPALHESAGDDDDEEGAPPAARLAAPTAAMPSGVGEGVDDDEENEGSILADYARVAAAGSQNNHVPAIAALPALAKVAAAQKHRVTERVLTLGELVAERARKRDVPQRDLSESVSGPSLAAAILRIPR